MMSKLPLSVYYASIIGCVMVQHSFAVTTATTLIYIVPSDEYIQLTFGLDVISKRILMKERISNSLILPIYKREWKVNIDSFRTYLTRY